MSSLWASFANVMENVGSTPQRPHYFSRMYKGIQPVVPQTPRGCLSIHSCCVWGVTSDGLSIGNRYVAVWIVVVLL